MKPEPSQLRIMILRALVLCLSIGAPPKGLILMERPMTIDEHGGALAHSPTLPAAPREIVFRESSRLRGTFETKFWKALTKQQARQVAAACEAFEDATKLYGKREGELGATAVRVARYLANMAHACRGRVDPSFDEICRKVRRSRAAVARALRNLVTHGFLERARRVERTARVGAGPQLRQTSNAYRVLLPAKAAALVERFFPLPSDQALRDAERSQEIERFEKQHTLNVAERSGMTSALELLEQAIARKRLMSLARVQ